MELALCLEKLTNEKLLNLQKVAEQNHDVQLMDFIESRFLAEQVKTEEISMTMLAVSHAFGR